MNPVARELDRSVHPLDVPAGGETLRGELVAPPSPCGVVLFAHGSGSSRHSARNRFVAETLHAGGVATVLFDLLTAEEERAEASTRHLRFDIGLLAQRLLAALAHVATLPAAAALAFGLFGASTGAAAALVAAAEPGSRVRAVVSRGGRPDLAGPALPHVRAATLLIVGERDEEVLMLNRAAYVRMQCVRELAVVPDATHLFEQPGTLAIAARLATEWFARHLRDGAPS